MEYIIDAKDKSLGRVASETAVILRGKKEADFAPNRLPEAKVKVINIAKIKIIDRKLKQKEYKSHSGYPGGLKTASLERVLEKKGMAFVFIKTLTGMLPKNKLRNKMIKNLIIE